MAALSTFPDGARAVVLGASGGIGRALTDRLSSDPSFTDVFTLSRSGSDDLPVDITDEASIARAAAHCTETGPLDLVIVATGILHDGDTIRPEKRMQDLDAGVMSRVLAVNTIGPALVAKHFLPQLRRKSKSVFAAISARVGSIGDNRLGGWFSYRASKAALNMLVKTLAVEHARQRPESIVLALHPGTVATALSAPFRGRVSADKLFTPDDAAARLLAVIDAAETKDSGRFLAWDGSRIEY
jgi:NAD(P)-dependent dehydrogenase (short-subunit alcohol dehydrogenase family)